MDNARIIALLAQGLTASQVISIVGCSIAYIKSLLETPEVLEEIEKQKKELFQEANEEEIVSNKYLSLEHKILKQIESQIMNAELKDTIRALEVVGNRQEKRLMRKSHEAMGAAGHFAPKVAIVNLNLPMHAIPEYTLNSNKEVIAVNGTGLSPMSGANVKLMFDAMQSGETLVHSI